MLVRVEEGGVTFISFQKPVPVPPLQQGAVVRLNLEHFGSLLLASKGDVAFAGKGALVIITNVRYSDFCSALRQACELLGSTMPRVEGARLELLVTKVVPERKFALARAVSMELILATTTRAQEPRRTDVVLDRELGGLRAVLERGEYAVYEVDKVVSISWRNGFSVQVVGEKRELKDVVASEAARIELAGPGPVSNLYLSLRAEDRLIAVGSDAVVYVRKYPGVPGVDVWALDPPISERDLLKCSSYYTFFLPRVIAFPSDRRRPPLARLEVYRAGERRELVLQSWEAIACYAFRIVKRRFSLPAGVVKRLPTPGCPPLPDLTGEAFRSAAQRFARTLAEAKAAVERLESSRRRPVRFKQLSPLEAFVEAFYARAPLRKLERVVEPWLRVFDAVKNLAPEASLYVVSYGRPGRRPALPGFRVSRDGFVSPLPSRYVPVSGIVLRGGEFERLYVDAYVRRLLEYQIAPRHVKVQMLLADLEEARRLLSAAGVDPASAPLARVVEALARANPGDNILTIALRHHLYRSLQPPPERDFHPVVKLIAGAVKTATREEAERIFTDLLEQVRVAVKYEMKQRGYSLRKGVMFLGSPDDVRRRILQTVADIRGRLLALLEAPEAVEELPLVVELGRVEALLSF